MNPIPTFYTLPDILNAFIRAAVEHGAGDDHSLWTYYSSELHRLHDVYRKLADGAKSFETTLRYRTIANICETLVSVDGNKEMTDDLRACAASAIARIKDAHGEGRAYLLGEFRFCMLAVDADYEDFGLTRDVFLAYLEQCVQPA